MKKKNIGDGTYRIIRRITGPIGKEELKSMVPGIGMRMRLRPGWKMFEKDGEPVEPMWCQVIDRNVEHGHFTVQYAGAEALRECINIFDIIAQVKQSGN